MVIEHALPSWLQKELDHFGILTGYGNDDIDPLEDYRPSKLLGLRPCNEAVGWTPSYLGEECPF